MYIIYILVGRVVSRFEEERRLHAIRRLVAASQSRDTAMARYVTAVAVDGEVTTSPNRGLNTTLRTK